MASPKKPIYFFFKKNKFLKDWKNSLKTYLKEKYSLKSFYNFKKFLNAFFFNPPYLVLYYYPKNKEGLEEIIRVRKSFNLINIPLILILDKLEPELLLSLAPWTDDFIILNDDVREAYLRIEYVFEKLNRISDNNPLTGLPGNLSITKTIERLMESLKPYAIAYVDLDNFKIYNDVYGFFQGDEMIKNLARIIVNTLSEFSKDDHFAGHIGGDDFVFIVPLEKAETVSKEIIKRFSLLVPSFLDKKDLERGYFISINRTGEVSQIPLPSISIAVVPIWKDKFKHIGEISARAAEVKKVAKSIKGNSYFIDRRK
uniref:diguanylate cyclase n=1 Tax=Thermodesulfobacterium geofontis TaxID=1295609 RepID=A0A7V4JQ52_9BACT